MFFVDFCEERSLTLFVKKKLITLLSKTAESKQGDQKNSGYITPWQVSAILIISVWLFLFSAFRHLLKNIGHLFQSKQRWTHVLKIFRARQQFALPPAVLIGLILYVIFHFSAPVGIFWVCIMCVFFLLYKLYKYLQILTPCPCSSFVLLKKTFVFSVTKGLKMLVTWETVTEKGWQDWKCHIRFWF